MTRVRQKRRPAASTPGSSALTSETPGRSHGRWGPLLLVLVALAVYGNSFYGVFMFDGLKEIVDNPRIRELWPLNRFFRTRRPVVELSFAVNYAISGYETWSYHLVNLAVHAACALTLFGLIRRALSSDAFGPAIKSRADPVALAATAIWTVHPLQTQAVTYIIQRAESLMALCYLLTIYNLARGARSHRAWPWYGFSIVACALGMGSKAVMVTAPVTALLYDRAFLSGSFKEALRRRWALYAGLACTWSVLWWCRIPAVVLNPAKTTVTVGLGYQGATPLEYALTQAGVLLYYLRLTLWPDALCLDYGWPFANSASQVWPALLIVGLFACGVAWALWKNHWLGFVGAWFFIILSPTSSAIPTQDPAFEHRMYLPSAAVIAMVVAGASTLVRALARTGVGPNAIRNVAAGLALTASGLLGLRTVERNRDYRSMVRMWRDVVAKADQNPRGWYNLGRALDAAGQSERALDHYRRAVELDPAFDLAYFGMGVSYARQGQLDEAIRSYREALQVNPRLVDARCNMANLLAAAGRVDEALAQYQRALRVRPRNTACLYNLGSTLLQTARFADAARTLRKVLSIDPDHFPARCNLGVALAESGRLDEAVRVYREVLAIDPEHANTHANLGIALNRLGRPAEAEAALRRALKLDPEHVTARAELASLRNRRTSP